MSLERNKAMARRFFEEAYNTGNLALLEQLLAPTYVDQKAPPGTPSGPQGIAAIVTMFRHAFPPV